MRRRFSTHPAAPGDTEEETGWRYEFPGKSDDIVGDVFLSGVLFSAEVFPVAGAMKASGGLGDSSRITSANDFAGKRSGKCQQIVQKEGYGAAAAST